MRKSHQNQTRLNITAENELHAPLETERYTLLLGECEDRLKDLPDNSVDSVVDDAPYGLGEVRDLLGLITAWIAGDSGKEHLGRGGFMGKAWDAGVPPPSTWREVYRVLKPGGHMLIFAGTRTVDLMGLSLRLAGFEIRDTIDWVYASGFPKSLNIAKALDKLQGVAPTVVGEKHTHDIRNGQGRAYGSGMYGGEATGMVAVAVTQATSDLAQQFEGFGTALKPAHEPIILCRKPLSESTIAKNVLRWGTGGVNIDGCRVGTDEYLKRPQGKDITGGSWSGDGGRSNLITGSNSGRWPTNIVFSHSPLCTQVGTKKVPGERGGKTSGRTAMWGQGKPVAGITRVVDADGMEAVTAWECAEGCPVRELDMQSGYSESNGGIATHTAVAHNRTHSMGKTNKDWQIRGHDDAGGASRYYPQFGYDESDLPALFLYEAKPAQSERNAACGDLPPSKKVFNGQNAEGSPDPKGVEQKFTTESANTHPTVKSVALMHWLCTLVTPLNGVVLDAHMGSGTTGMGAMRGGYHFIGIDREAEYIEIARRRIAWEWQKMRDRPVQTMRSKAKNSVAKPKTEQTQLAFDAETLFLAEQDMMPVAV